MKILFREKINWLTSIFFLSWFLARSLVCVCVCVFCRKSVGQRNGNGSRKSLNQILLKWLGHMERRNGVGETSGRGRALKKKMNWRNKRTNRIVRAWSGLDGRPMHIEIDGTSGGGISLGARGSMMNGSRAGGGGGGGGGRNVKRLQGGPRPVG